VTAPMVQLHRHSQWKTEQSRRTHQPRLLCRHCPRKPTLLTSHDNQYCHQAHQCIVKASKRPYHSLNGDRILPNRLQPHEVCLFGHERNSAPTTPPIYSNFRPSRTKENERSCDIKDPPQNGERHQFHLLRSKIYNPDLPLKQERCLTVVSNSCAARSRLTRVTAHQHPQRPPQNIPSKQYSIPYKFLQAASPSKSSNSGAASTDVAILYPCTGPSSSARPPNAGTPTKSSVTWLHTQRRTTSISRSSTAMTGGAATSSDTSRRLG